MPEELASWAGGAVLWECLCDVRDWAVWRNGRKAERISEITLGTWIHEIDRIGQVDIALQQPLLILRDLLTVPKIADREAVSLACRHIAGWAGETARPVTEFYFSAIGVLGSPGNVREAFRVGRLARALAFWGVAECWLGYTVALAEHRRDGATHVAATLGIGNIYYRQGHYRRAREIHRTALIIACKYGVLEYQAQAYHDLFVAAMMLQEEREADDYAYSALKAYGQTHPNVLILAHDVAQFWLRTGRSSRALGVLQAVLPRMNRPGYKLLILSGIARAAGESGLGEMFEQTWREFWHIAGDPKGAAFLAASLLQLSYGARCLGDIGRAQAAAQEAVRIAEERGEVDVSADGAAFLASLESELPVGPVGSQSGYQVPKQTSLHSGVGEEKSELAEALIRSLVADHVLRSAGNAPHSEPVVVEDWMQPEPHAAADTPHTAFRYHPHRLQIVEYATFVPSDGEADSPWEQLLRFEMEGSPSFNRVTRTNVAPPHVHGARVPGGVRAALPHEIPARPW